MAKDFTRSAWSRNDRGTMTFKLNDWEIKLRDVTITAVKSDRVEIYSHQLDQYFVLKAANKPQFTPDSDTLDRALNRIGVV